jgi:hypothetical protein
MVFPVVSSYAILTILPDENSDEIVTIPEEVLLCCGQSIPGLGKQAFRTLIRLLTLQLCHTTLTIFLIMLSPPPIELRIHGEIRGVLLLKTIAGRA